MTLRSQKRGKPTKVWSLDDLRDGLRHFYAEHNRYPTTTEFNSYSYLPSARTIERRFGGLVELRKTLKLDAQSDLRFGEHSRKRAFAISKRAHLVENKVYGYLQNRFGKEFVHREFFFTDDKRTRADFFVYDAEKGFCVDVFYPENRQNLIGCLNSKLDKYLAKYMREYPVIYLQMNEGIEQGILDDIVANKKRKLPANQKLMSWGTFQQFCESKKALAVKR